MTNTRRCVCGGELPLRRRICDECKRKRINARTSRWHKQLRLDVKALREARKQERNA